MNKNLKSIKKKQQLLDLQFPLSFFVIYIKHPYVPLHRSGKAPCMQWI